MELPLSQAKVCLRPVPPFLLTFDLIFFVLCQLPGPSACHKRQVPGNVLRGVSTGTPFPSIRQFGDLWEYFYLC